MSDPIAEAADLLLAARRDPTKKLASLPEALRPVDMAAAYAIQSKVAAGFGPIGVWKVGVLTAGGPPPMCSALPASGVMASPAKLKSPPHGVRGIEAEISVRIGEDLPVRATPYTREDVAQAIAAIHPAIEVLDSRYIEPKNVDSLQGLADCQQHGNFVYGEPVEAWQAIDLAAESCEQTVDGEYSASSKGHPGGDLLGQVVWLANVGSVWAGGLKAGQYVTCGTWSGAKRVGPEAKVRVKFSTAGDVAVDYIG